MTYPKTFRYIVLHIQVKGKVGTELLNEVQFAFPWRKVYRRKADHSLLIRQEFENATVWTIHFFN